MKQHTPEYLSTLRTHENGNICCDSPILANRCTKCQAHAAAEKRTLRTNIRQEDTVKNDYTPPDSYAPSLAKLRAANATPESTFAEQYKADRLRELDAEYARVELRAAQQPRPCLTAAELATFSPPNPYASLKENR